MNHWTIPNGVKAAVVGAWLLFLGIALLPAQTWHATDSIPLYRGTDAQLKGRSAVEASTRCMNQLKQLTIAVEVYRSDYEDRSPTNWAQCECYIDSPATLVCPSSPDAISDTNWGHFDFSRASYTLFPTSITSPRAPMIVCRFHGHCALADATWHEGKSYALFDLPTDSGLGLPQYTDYQARKIQRGVQCINNLKQLMNASLVYESDGNGIATSFAQLQEYGLTPECLFCPAAEVSNIPTNFDGFDFSRVTYTIAALKDSGIPYIRCPLHGNCCDVDGNFTEGSAAYNYPAEIAGDPISQTVNPGGTVTFQIPINSSMPAPKFQWRRQQPFDAEGNPWTNTVILAGATNSSLVISNCTAQDEGYYDVLVSLSSGYTKASRMVFLRVEAITNITSHYDWEALSCAQNLRQILLAGVLENHVTGETNTVFPSSPKTYAGVLSWPIALICPADSARTAPSTWDLTNSDISYEINEGIPFDLGSPRILATCKVHHFYVCPDTTLVLAGPSIIVAAQADQKKLTLSWSGGNPPFQIQMTTNLSSGLWTDFGGPINSNNISLPLTSFSAFYKVVGTTPHN